MNVFISSISQVFKGSIKAFQTFPVAVGSALAFAVVTMIRIQLDWPQQEAYNLLFNSLHWAFALGAIFGLAAITGGQSRFNTKKAFLVANLLGVAVVAATFLMLYLLGGTKTGLDDSNYVRVSVIAASRVSVAILVSFLAFIILAGYPKDQSDFVRSFFMTHKAFFIALVYGLVIMAGTSGVAGAVQALLYRGMSEKVYEYIGTLVGFLTFTIFIGYFPDFRKGQIDERREEAQKQPRFIEILFEYIIIPIVLALTAVLLIWAGKTIITGSWPVFMQLYRIATSYAIFGIWLHIMVTHYESRLAKFYRQIYPFAALIILAFEARAILIQLNRTGLKDTEYFFILILIFAVAASILLLIKKTKSHPVIAIILCALAVFAVLPVAGYHALPATCQANRLENMLVSHGMLKNNKLIPAAKEPERALRESVTDAVNYLAYAQDAKLPPWFDKHLGESDVFKIKLGFEQTWPAPEDTFVSEPKGNIGLFLTLPAGAIDIGEYDWVVNLQQEKLKDTATIKGNKGLYRISWTAGPPNNIPVLKIELNDRVILQQSMNAYIDKIKAKFSLDKTKNPKATVKDMSLQLETPEITVLLIFNNIEINVDPQHDVFNYWLDLNALYIKEKP